MDMDMDIQTFALNQNIYLFIRYILFTFLKCSYGYFLSFIYTSYSNNYTKRLYLS